MQKFFSDGVHIGHCSHCQFIVDIVKIKTGSAGKNLRSLLGQNLQMFNYSDPAVVRRTPLFIKKYTLDLAFQLGQGVKEAFHQYSPSLLSP
jgi:hypothetical protein